MPPVPAPYDRGRFNRALITNALLDPFNVVLLAVVLIAGILLGLFAAGLVVDFAAENWSAGTADQTFALFGGSFTLTQMQVVLAAAVLGAGAVALCIVGAGLLLLPSLAPGVAN